ncbi:hypothetical protein ISF_08294 [Cordyceps fumosorosea ARSEF 2679]|uniref:Uncharacterized protein n=1 Tax=Cordyceps fumosorosea (strain ARSEF 2679) TaxID=1081104 RepID=A0A167MS26_CORFA|nr:hypothetical protein ISF_08294 [Cordyceps fumosorosea ARSEF 2679]OAA54693.1 hypothetical protein ISF_08294 [Cordyceps fumosorosea ARSEF 2679]
MSRRASSLLLALFTATFFYFATHVRWRAVPAPALPNWRHHSGLASTAAASNLTVDLVLATLGADDISWTAQLSIPNLRVLRYVSDDPAAPLRPPVPRKGREALIYHTYFHDFYDDLPDVSVMAHAEERPWHLEGALQQSMRFALDRLDLERARARGYANLRVSWADACPAWLDTTRTPETADKQEEPYMRAAMAANFGLAEAEVPRVLAGPCCSQFAVSREAVRRHPRAQYRRSRDWLVETPWSDYVAGRTWEHMFQWLFRGAAVDCPREASAYCAMYGVCFEGDSEAARYNELWQERRDLEEATEVLREVLDPQEGVKARRRMAELDAILRRDITFALERGMDEATRSEAFDNLWAT